MSVLYETDDAVNVRDEIRHVLSRSPRVFYTLEAIAETVGYSESYVKAILETMPVERESVKLKQTKGRGLVIVRWGRE
jgi:hypothetical protein